MDFQARSSSPTTSDASDEYPGGLLLPSDQHQWGGRELAQLRNMREQAENAKMEYHYANGVNMSDVETVSPNDDDLLDVQGDDERENYEGDDTISAVDAYRLHHPPAHDDMTDRGTHADVEVPADQQSDHSSDVPHQEGESPIAGHSEDTNDNASLISASDDGGVRMIVELDENGHFTERDPNDAEAAAHRALTVLNQTGPSLSDHDQARLSTLVGEAIVESMAAEPSFMRDVAIAMDDILSDAAQVRLTTRRQLERENRLLRIIDDATAIIRNREVHEMPLKRAFLSQLRQWNLTNQEMARLFVDFCKNAVVVTQAPVRFWEILRWFYRLPRGVDLAICALINHYCHLARVYSKIADCRARLNGLRHELSMADDSEYAVLMWREAAFGYEMDSRLADDPPTILTNSFADFIAPPEGLSVQESLKRIKANSDIRVMRCWKASRVLGQQGRTVHAAHAYVWMAFELWQRGARHHLACMLEPGHERQFDPQHVPMVAAVSSELLRARRALHQTLRVEGDLELWEGDSA